MTGDADMVTRAAERAGELGLEWMCLDVRDEFRRKVVDGFVSEYASGRTPSPCVRCNTMVKWRFLDEVAISRGIRHIATGHYFRLSHGGNGKVYIRKAADPYKDQSYYLWDIPQPLLRKALTPMGEKIKKEIAGSSNAYTGQRESMGICFLRGRPCNEFIGERVPESPGDVVDAEGRVIGIHKGIAFYTVGQKRCPGIFLNDTGNYSISGDMVRGAAVRLPAGQCVTGIEPELNRVVIGSDTDLYHHRLIVSLRREVLAGELFSAGDVTAVIRGIGRNPGGFCRIRAIPGRTDNDSRIIVELSDPAWAPSPGQPVVFYRGDLVVGGGILEQAL